MELSVENGEKPDFFVQIQKIYEIKEQAGGINDLFYEFAEPHLQFLSSHLKISLPGTALLAILVNLYSGDSISITRLAKNLKCKLIEVIAYFDEFETLEQKGLLHIIRQDDDLRENIYNNGSRREIEFELMFNTINELRKGNFTDPDAAKNLSIDKFLVHLERLCEDRIQRRQSYNNTKKVMQNLLGITNTLLL